MEHNSIFYVITEFYIIIMIFIIIIVNREKFDIGAITINLSIFICKNA